MAEIVVRYAAFLRGINVGGRVLMKMADLKHVFEEINLNNVRTILASGNVIFETKRKDKKALQTEIETAQKQEFAREISVLLRTFEELQSLHDSNPFKGIKVTPTIRLYVTFLTAKAKPKTISVPYESAQKEFKILRATSLELFSVLDLSKGKGTIDVMNILEKEFGSNVTTRNWNTIEKVLAA